jgi:hypothetical protein
MEEGCIDLAASMAGNLCRWDPKLSERSHIARRSDTLLHSACDPVHAPVGKTWVYVERFSKNMRLLEHTVPVPRSTSGRVVGDSCWIGEGIGILETAAGGCTEQS